jgi:D-alanyl-D-alanine carboxypeptidase (penicillin-binding protein 5/6)
MNARAAELGLEHTSYANPIGLDEAGNYSSARDLASLARVLLRRPRFARIVDMPEAQLESGARPRVVENRNDLISAYPWVSGVKTGYTANAGNVLVGAADGPGGARVISVVLGEPTESGRNSETLALLRWGLTRFHRVRVLDPHKMVALADIEYRDGSARLVPRRSAVLTIRDGQRVRRRRNAPDEVKGPLSAGARVGTVTVLLDGRPVRRVALVTAEKVPGAGTLRVLLSWLGIPLTLLLLVAILVAAVLVLLKLPFRIRIVR